MNYRLLIIILLFLPFRSMASGDFNYWKKLFDNKSGDLECFEGIYKVRLAIENTLHPIDCRVKNFINPEFDTICIYKYSNEIKVYSLKYSKEIGKLNIKKQIKSYFIPADKYYENIQLIFQGNGSKNYPSTDVSLNGRINLQFKDDIVVFDLFNYMFRYNDKDNLLSPEIAQRIEYTCYSDGHLNKSLNLFQMQSELKRIYPNKNQPPVIEGTASGTGVIISNDGYVLTNFHVVKELKYNWIWKSSDKNKDNLEINIYNWQQIGLDESRQNDIDLCSDSIYSTINGKFYNMRVVEANLIEDWVILKIDDSTFRTADFAVFDTSNIDIGNEVYTLGFPISAYYGNDIKYTNGYISSNSNKGFYSVNMGINPGNSGAGLFNKSNGQLIGLTTSRFNENSIGVKVEGVSFSVRLNNSARLLKTKNQLFLNYIYNDDSRCWSCLYYRVSYRKRRMIKKPKILIKDSQYSPKISTNRNLNATVQIFSE